MKNYEEYERRELVFIEEGFFKNGMKNGYCRVINVEKKTVECGFFRDNLPSGKFTKWKGEDELVEEGIYRGISLTRKSVDNFVYNIESNYY